LSLLGVPYSELTVGVPKESFQNEKRVAITPANVALLKKKGFKAVVVEKNAGHGAKFSDAEYVAAGAEVKDSKAVFESGILIPL